MIYIAAFQPKADIFPMALTTLDTHELVKQLAVEIPQAQQVVIPDAAHIVNMEQSAEFNRIVLEFLKNCPT